MRNLKIDKKEKKAELELNSDFYQEDVLREVVKDFGEVFVADIKKSRGKFNITLKLKSSEVGIEEAAYNFLNYLLAEVKNNMAGV